ncbi:ABC-2 type transport system permease protein [Pilibacter termitis]|uniref:Transport permease protein n=1 Tax=Pilibacter termitis TaxID=263852 RepID=A0A1T4M0K5_9ENTE|nr:ABC transporter permease [Pilibacter termitis]SJZ60513.1 ABC-2 type transport system permease protein [Pilibacter termitis]
MKTIEFFKGELRKYLFELKTYYPDQIVSVLITIFIFIVMGMMNGNMNDSTFYVGFVYWFLLSSLIGEAAISTSSEKQMGILDQLMIQPVGLKKLIIIRSSVWGMVNFIKVILSLVILKIILGLPIGFHWGMIPLFLVVSFGILGFTLFLCALTLKYTKTASFESIISYSLMILSGAVFPLASLPKAIQLIGNYLPITQGIAMSKKLILGETVSLQYFVPLAVVSIIYFFIGFLLFNFILEKSRVAGLDKHY